MKELYTVIAFIIFGYALRSCKTIALRKLGALVMLAASGLCFYYLFESVLAGILAMAAWFFPALDRATYPHTQSTYAADQ